MDKTHQINNALTKIKVIYDMLITSQDKPDEYIEHLEIELEKIKRIIYDLRCNS